MIDFDILATALKDVPEFTTPEPTIPVMGNPMTEEQPPHDEERDGKLIILPDIVDSATFIGQALPEPPALIHGLVHQGTKVIVGGGSKSFKTWIQLDAAICVAYGLPWLGFETTPGRVLFVNFEIQPVFFQQRIKTICDARGLTLEPERLDVWNLRGFSAPYAILIPQIIQRIQSASYAKVVLDPIYKLYGSANENDASEVAQLLNSLERVCVDTGATVMFGAHYSKGNQSAKESIDRISGSGVFARDPDSIIPFTRHEEEGSFVVEPTLRNLPPVEAFVVTWNYPFMERDHLLDPSKLRQVAGRPKENASEDILRLLKGRRMNNLEWQNEAVSKLKISRSTFFRLKSELKSHNLIMFSHVDDTWVAVEKE